jgi:hypothetical protein
MFLCVFGFQSDLFKAFLRRRFTHLLEFSSLQWLTAKRSGSVCLAYVWLKFPLDKYSVFGGASLLIF